MSILSLALLESSLLDLVGCLPCPDHELPNVVVLEDGRVVGKTLEHGEAGVA